MFELPKIKDRWKIDISFIIVLIILLLSFWRALPDALELEVNWLFFGTFSFFFLGVLFFYLIFDMNPKLGLVIHAVFFPLASGLFFFTDWVPTIKPKIGQMTTPFYTMMGVYLLILIGYFGLQLIIYLREKDSEEGSTTSRVTGQSVTWRD